MQSKTESNALLSAATATGAGRAVNMHQAKLSFQAVGRTTSGAGTATVSIEVSDVPTPTQDSHWMQAMEIELTLTNTADVSDGQQIDAKWKWVRANVTAISGTNASVDVYMAG
jgi:hypothetical protein